MCRIQKVLLKNNREVVVATNNPGKILEIQEILKDLPYQVLPIRALDENFSVEEDELTYAENAIKKARYAVSCTGKLAIADDSGLEVLKELMISRQ